MKTIILTEEELKWLNDVMDNNIASFEVGVDISKPQAPFEDMKHYQECLEVIRLAKQIKDKINHE